MARIKGPLEQRKALREQNRARNRANHIRQRAQHANGHQRVVIACEAARSASRRITDTARRALAKEIADAVDRYDTAQNWKEQP